MNRNSLSPEFLFIIGADLQQLIPRKIFVNIRTASQYGIPIFPDGFFWTDDTTSIGGSVGSFWVEISGGLVGFDVC